MTFLEQAVFDIQGSKMYLDELDSLHLAEYGYYEKDVTDWINQNITENDTCVDIGAHIGYFTLMMSKKARYVYAYEPYLFNFRILQKNILLNNCYNVILCAEAVADRQGAGMIFPCSSNSGMHRIYPSKWCEKMGETVSFTKLGGIFLISVPTFIKIDCEGSEYGALIGMEQLLKREHPTIIMEFDPPSIMEYGRHPREEFDLLTSLHYDPFMFPDVEKSTSFIEASNKALELKYGVNLLWKYSDP